MMMLLNYFEIFRCLLLRKRIFLPFSFKTDQDKMDQVFQETRNLRPMTNQVAYNTFISNGYDKCVLPTGPKVRFFPLIYEVGASLAPK